MLPVYRNEQVASHSHSRLIYTGEFRPRSARLLTGLNTSFPRVCGDPEKSPPPCVRIRMNNTSTSFSFRSETARTRTIHPRRPASPSLCSATSTYRRRPGLSRSTRLPQIASSSTSNRSNASTGTRAQKSMRNRALAQSYMYMQVPA